MPDATYQVLHEDARNLSLPDCSVQMIFTSVPYWGLRKYLDDSREIGREETLEEWLDNLVACAREWRRVLRNDGTLWCNIGDTYASGGRGTNPHHRQKMGAGTASAQNLGRKVAPSGFKDKDLIMLPARLALTLQADGWYLRSAIVWAKGLDWTDAERGAQEQIRDALALVREHATGSMFGLSKELKRALKQAEKAVDRLVLSGAVMPESVTDRLTSSYEMLFLFSKSPRYYYDREAIRVGIAPASIERISSPSFANQSGGESDYGRTGVSRHRSARQALEGFAQKVHRDGNRRSFRGGGAYTGGNSFDNSTAKGNEEAGNDGASVGRNARNVWRIPVENSPSGGYQLSDGRCVAHFATFPMALATRAILASTSEAGCCAKCGAPFIRVKHPTPEYAELLGRDWADYDQDATEGRGHSVSPQRPTKRGVTATAEYATVGWAPTRRCFGEPIEAGVTCPKCRGTGKERDYPQAKRMEDSPYNVTSRNSALRRSGGAFTTLIEQGGNGKVETGNPCSACLCPDCGGTGKEHAYPRGNEPYRAHRLPGRGPTSLNTDHDGKDFAKPQPTGRPCPTCNGIGATGVVNGEVWSPEVLEAWPRKPCMVLDPMAGTGQTGMAALDLGRSVILNDLNPDYCDLMRERLGAWPGDLSGPKGNEEEEEEDVLPLFAQVPAVHSEAEE